MVLYNLGDATPGGGVTHIRLIFIYFKDEGHCVLALLCYGKLFEYSKYVGVFKITWIVKMTIASRIHL